MLNAKQSPNDDTEIKDFLKNKKLNFKASHDKEKAYKNVDFNTIANRLSNEISDVT